MVTMAPVLLPRMLDGGSPNIDALGIFYVVAAIIYTLILAGELYVLYRRRSAFCVRIRNIEVVFTAVTSLHVYLILVLLVYPLNGRFTCSAEFWIMSVFLPSGMAFFQACNARVLKAYESQRRLQKDFLAGARKKRLSYTPCGLFEAWMDLDAAAKVYVGTCVGLVLSFIPAIILFFGSRRFHAGYGFFGPVVSAIPCRRGGEWVPSILTQLFWSAAVGPWILWKIRRVNDVHSWAWQTRLAIIAGLPGTPLWMAFTYGELPGMLAIKNFFPPAGWFIPSLVVCQQVLILIPLREAAKSPIKRRDSIAPSTDSDSLSLTSTPSASSQKSTHAVLSKELKPKASMQALEFSIEHSIDALIDWTASREFTAENTIFLREVRNFKKKWSSLRTVTTAQRRQMHTEASLIFFTLINPFTAETPINIEYKIFKRLQRQFEGMEYDPYMPRSRTPSDPMSPTARENVVCPWENTLDRPASFESNTSASSTASTRSLVPSEFTDDVFDAAFESIKYLVFTNTWPRYVEAELAGTARSP
ncbi:hypothetical protein K458DRAFT_339737 [Lentithecium fluviatile CBS 122367]|uniref:RGS domain-containing protein n=1 Tax=Lentithecium fluviatile CBS 122367 TaxID=1168545 RepID=A0A6G1IZW9_9PLEO|nr:hypothetical protein K458DRAFT_339737 [Lentithecium fluviatile CBS 122367]